MPTTMWFFGMAFRFPILFYLGGSGGNTGQTSLRMMKKGRRSYVFKIGNSAIYGAILRYTGVLAALGSVVAGLLHNCSGYAGSWPWLLAAALRRQENAKTHVPGFWARWALSWPESCIAVPATLVSGRGSLPRRRRADAK